METPLNASSNTAGALLSGGRFSVPQFQREYAWERDEISEFFDDLSGALLEDTYFLGLIILTGDGPEKDIVDGQQRLLTITLLAAALYHEAKKNKRRALADRLQSTFLKSIDFASDEELPRLKLSAEKDDRTLQQILLRPASDIESPDINDESISAHLTSAYRLLTKRVEENLRPDPFKRLGIWADFLTNKLYLASFVHPDPSSAYRVFEVVNTRGKELTTADLLKSFILSQTPENQKNDRYHEWQRLAASFDSGAPTTFVQFIRHAVTTREGHVLPRDLYDALAGRSGSKPVLTPAALIELLQESLPAYLQMTDPTASGPVTQDQLAVFSVFNSLNVLSIRPLLLALLSTPNAVEGMRELLRLVVRRIVVGNLGTGNVERRFGQAAHRVAQEGVWEPALESLSDLNHDREEFRSQIQRRSMNKKLLTVIRRSILQQTITPKPDGYLFLIKPRSAEWSSDDEDRATYWSSTIGNSFLADEERRPQNSSTWAGFKKHLLPLAADGEWTRTLDEYKAWNIDSITEVGDLLADEAASIWYTV
ncbi:DUF262 domain-containing protein [Rhodococcus sp. 14-2483-1-2]|uniref:DUF262 domain-containing protein n=1 Tax=Rhodococcus sp. 14-2483-1-2 TaxID=2023147 RepID=UPI000B9A443C|nr:DUF262 domain-containing protein [Rhodococcus sp. 14-2483-1-2]OZF29436.1 hypothetical protein CH295_18010 [Rhodococcus sp. 14-2483-1-2]